MKKFLITSALPYANGPLHFGHITGVYLPADIYSRHRRLQGHEVLHISGSDEHGVAIMLNAQKVKKEYKQYVDEWHREHKKLFEDYLIQFDFFGQTSADYHAEEVLKWFKRLNEKGYIAPKNEQQLFCKDCEHYLPDRFVEGTCYACDYPQARGDECPNCGEWIDSVKLKNPVCKICGSKNIEERTVTQWYLLLSKFHENFRKWFDTKRLSWRKTVVPYVDSLSEKNLQDRAITRDLDWGIDVPLAEAKGKKLYVWFDAPIGYVSNTKKHLQEINSKENYLKDWWHNPEVEISHFIGKDNIIFHTIIFPVMSMATDFILPPTQVPANQYLNLEGKQFSKSSGWYVDAKSALSEFGSDALRYYLTTLIPETSDSSFTWDGFKDRINGELANNIGNLVSRALKFLMKNFPQGVEGKYVSGFCELEATKKIILLTKEYTQCVDQFQIRKGLEILMEMGQIANTYFSDQAPWKLIKEGKLEEGAKVLTTSSLHIFILGVFFEPYLPALSQKILDNYEFPMAAKKEIYQGHIQSIEKLFAHGLKLKKEPENLVPKIDEKRIEELKVELTKLKDQV